jgi:ribosomal protein S18 acetylase RimI-like enzyme
MPFDISIRPLEPQDIPTCEEILRGLPEWFGFEEALVQYVRDLESSPSFVALGQGEILGFIALRHHNPLASEIHVLAVRRGYHRSGIGKALVQHAESELAWGKVKLLQVKTLGPSHPDPGYEATRAFYFALGFIPLEETKAFWGENQPCLVMVKPLPAAWLSRVRSASTDSQG